MKKCFNCNSPLKENICLECGAARYESKDCVVKITAQNWNKARIPEWSEKFYQPFIKTAIKEITAEKLAE